MSSFDDVQKLFEKLVSGSGSVSTSLAELKKELLASSAETNLVQLFPQSAVVNTDRTLCAVIGMVQEVEPSIAFFDVGSYFNMDHLGDREGLVDAQALFVVPVPGCVHLYPRAVSRCSDPEHIEDDAATRAKRPHCDSGEDDGLEAAAATTSSQPETKQARRDIQAHTGSGKRAGASVKPLWQQLNLPHEPLREDLHVACSAVVLDPQASPVRVGDVALFLGFTDDHYQTGCDGAEDDLSNFSTFHADQLPPGLVRRLICFAHSLHIPKRPERLITGSQDGIGELRKEAKSYLTQALCGDDGAAELLLLHLCSRVMFRSQQIPIGDVPLFLHASSWTAADAQQLSIRLRDVLPMGEVLIDLQKAHCEQLLHPKQNYERNALESGPLQVGSGSHVSLWIPSSVSNCGHDDVLLAALHRQVLVLEYPYSEPVEVPTDVSFLVMSDSLPARLSLPSLRLAISATVMATSSAGTLREQLSGQAAVREYFTYVRHHCGTVTGVSDAVAQLIQEDLVRMKQQHPRQFNSDALLHNNTMNCLVALTKLRALSHGRSEVLAGDYEQVMALHLSKVDAW